MALSRANIVILTAGITACVTSVVWLGAGAAAYWYLTSDSSSHQPPFVINIESPNTAVTGEQVHLAIEVSNPTDGDLELGSIDIYDSLIDGFAILSADPPPDSRNNMFGFTTLYYAKTLKAGTSFTVSLTLEAEEAGVWTGDIDICTPSEDFVSRSHTIVVTNPPPPAQRPEPGDAEQPAIAPEAMPADR